MSDVVGNPPILKMMALIIDIPGARCNSEYTASFARFHINRLSGHLRFDNGWECGQWTRVCAYRQARRAGEMRSLFS
jgi:hypothetical protein